MFMIPKYRSGRSFARLAKTSVVCRRIAEANALPSAKRVLLIVVPSILSADTRFPAASTTDRHVQILGAGERDRTVDDDACFGERDQRRRQGRRRRRGLSKSRVARCQDQQHARDRDCWDRCQSKTCHGYLRRFQKLYPPKRRLESKDAQV